MSGPTREVVTLQVGHYANFVGTHWWNIQESSFVYSSADLSGPKEVNHDVMFREGTNLSGDVTYTPRLIAFDLKGSLNTLRQEGVLYDVQEQEEDLKWNSDVTLHKSDGIHKNEFLRDLDSEEARYLGLQDGSGDTQLAGDSESDTDVTASVPPSQPDVFGPKFYDLDSSVEVWSDFLRPHLHPRSIHLLSQYQHNESDSFNVFGYGQKIFQNHAEAIDIEDRLHFFLEECDYMQGLHVLADTWDGFAGFSSSLLEHLADEYSSKSLLVFALSPSTFDNLSSRQNCYRLMNTALAYSSLLQHSSLMLPLSTATTLWPKPGPPVTLPYLTYKNNLAYHSSAIIASSLDTVSMPYRLEKNASLMTHLTQALTPAERKVSCLFTSLPFPHHRGSTITNSLQELGTSLPWQPLTPVGSNETTPIAQSVVLRGVPCRTPTGSSSLPVVEELMQNCLRSIYPDTLSACCHLRQPCKVTSPYPHIFSSLIDTEGHICDKERLEKIGVENVPVMTGLQCTPLVGQMLCHLHHNSAKLDIKKLHQFSETGLEEDELSEALDFLLMSAQLYDKNSEIH